jgi:spermidine synthase
MYHEPLVHPASVLAGGPVNVLVLGGGDGATLREVLKWRSVRRAVLVDLDEQVVEACRRYLPEMHQGSLNDPRVEVRIADAYDFFDTDGSKWDLIISDLTDPVESGPSYKLFSQHYFRKCRQALSIGGCFVLQAGLAGPVEMHLHVQIARSVGRVFDRMWHFISPVPTWASPMGFVIGTGSQVEWNDPEPLHIDDLLKHKTNGRFRMFDGRVMRGLMHPPKYLREAVGVDL